jgi:phosphotransferase system enzyme I (PtsI)
MATGSERLVLGGPSCTRGMALGRARLIHPSHFDVSEARIQVRQVSREIARFEDALEHAQAEMSIIREKLSGSLAKELGEMLDAHAMLLQDPMFTDAVRMRIRNERIDAHTALKRERDRLMAEFETIDDPYLKSRSEDIEQTIGRVVAALYRDADERIDPKKLAGEIVVSDQVAPADMADWHAHGMLGVVTDAGSPLSHSAILARSLQLPMLCGVADALSRIHDGDVILLDGEAGQVIVHPDESDQARFDAWQKEAARDSQQLTKLRKTPTRTSDGTEIKLWANAERLEDISLAHSIGATGVGLYRTEFLFLQRPGLPDENEQYEAYAAVVRSMKGRTVTIRTLDIGADKADRSGLALAYEPNPALGLRGVRLSLARQDVFSTQLRAILRAAAHGPVRVLVPMVSEARELRLVRKLFKPARKSLESAGYEIGQRVEMGAMIEVPAAAIAIEPILAEAEFVSIGTNDLTQYLLAADRNNDAVSNLYEPAHAALDFLIERVVRAANAAGKPVAVCGEIAGDPPHVERLLRLGIRELSMHPSRLLEVRRAITNMTLPA